MPAARRAAIRATGFVVAIVSIGLAGSERASAHRRDELLQAARIAIERDRVDIGLDLTPGIAVAEAIVSGIDRDRDGRLSRAEQDAYVARVRDAVELAVDGRVLRVEPIAVTFPTPDAMRRGEGTIQVRYGVALDRLAVGRHHLVFRNGYQRDVSAYLANALEPRGDAVLVTAQRRDVDQHDLAIDFAVQQTGDPALPPWWVLGCVASAGLVAAYVTRPARLR